MNIVNLIAIIAGIILLGIFTIGVILKFLYKRATKESAFVRTGLGGEKVIKDGGALVLPVVHDIIPVNMKTLKLPVVRRNEDSLITKDRMRVNVEADFYVRVQPTEEGISKAAQTLGKRTLNPDELKSLIEGKFVDALRNVAARMTLSELHENRTEFVQQVQQTLKEDLEKNGLELESVSLTALDQTPQEYLNPENNAFDAEGAKVLTEIIQKNKEIRNKIERETEVKIKQKDLETKQEKLELEQTEKILEAEQKAKIAEEEAKKEKEAEAARIEAEKEIEKARILKQKEIEKSEIEKQKAIREAEIQKEKEIKEAEIQKEIAIAERIKEESAKQAEANLAKAKEREAEEKIKTAAEIEQAEREKRLAIIEAEKDAEQIAIEKKVQAEAEKEAAKDLAEAITVEAKAKADAIKIEAEAKEKQYEVEAEGKRKLYEAENVLSERIIEFKIKEQIIKVTPEIVAQMVKPVENIDSIKIAEIGGLNGFYQSGESSSSSSIQGNGNLANSVVDAALKYKMHAPLVEDLMKDVGIDLSKGLNGISEVLTENKENTNKENDEVKSQSKSIKKQPKRQRTAKKEPQEDEKINTERLSKKEIEEMTKQLTESLKEKNKED